MEDKEHANPQIKFVWDAPLRPYIKRSSEVLRFYLAVTLICSSIVILLGDPILLLPLWALLFIFYIFTVTPPEIITNKITQFGVETVGATYRWEVLSYFYFTERFGYDQLVMVSHAPEFHHIYLVVPSEKVKSELVRLLSQHLVYQERPARTITDRLIEWFSKLVPREDTVTQTVASQKP
ncbi:hypothetical protein HYS00_00545 [Candidatus Microgenomates bacterium]|nr:hypothetical protein [Candidatus Microgenomates bacterium]